MRWKKNRVSPNLSLTPRKLAPITPTSNGAARLLLAAEALVQMSGLKRDCLDIQEQVFSALLVGCLSQGLTGMLGLGDGVVFVCYLTLLVKKKEKRGRRVSARF